MKEDQLPDEFRAARFKLLNAMEFIYKAVLSMRPIMTDKVPTMGVDKYWRLYMNPEMVTKKWSLSETATVLLHEVHHLLREHSARATDHGVKKEDHVRWNIAADMSINSYLTEGLPQDFKLPNAPDGSKGGVFPEDFGLPVGLTAEEYYQLLEGKIQTIKIKIVGMGNEGSGVTGEKADWELEGEPGDGDRVDPRQVAFEVAQAAKEYKSKNRGSLPGWAEELIETMLGEPQIPWTEILRQYLRQAITIIRGQTDYSYARPSRRGYLADVILPGTVAPEIEASAVVDTSGSMGDLDLKECLREVNGVIAACGGKLRLHEADVGVTHSETVTGKIQKKEFHGRGGTDMSQAILDVMEKDKAPLIIVFTDGYTGWPEEPVKAKVIACIVGRKREEGEYTGAPPWIKVVNCWRKEEEK